MRRATVTTPNRPKYCGMTRFASDEMTMQIVYRVAIIYLQVTLHDMILKNIEKIKRPRSSNTDALYWCWSNHRNHLLSAINPTPPAPYCYVVVVSWPASLAWAS